MSFPIEKKISNLVPFQFPSFYNDYGPSFIAFTQAYYAWLEETGNPAYYGRRQLESFDIDETLDEFLEHFQKKYLYGIPFDVIINKRSLIKHVLDAYRSKGSVQCFKLLFRLIYNEDVEVYLPGNDLIRPSDGTWIQPRYVELSDSSYNAELVGKTIVGISSSSEAVVETVVRMPYANSIITLAYVTNIIPRDGDFEVGETVIEKDLIANTDFSTLVKNSPSVLGSLKYVNVSAGGQNFAIGDMLSVIHTDPSNGAVVSHGQGARVKVTGLSAGNGQLAFTIANYGYGISLNANIYLYANTLDTSATGASFDIGPLASAQTYTFNTDLIGDYYKLNLNAASFGFTGNSSANLTNANLSQIFQYSNNTFGALSTLTNVKAGTGYTRAAQVFIYDSIVGNPLSGTISYNTASANLTGTSTSFTELFTNGEVIVIQANTSLANTKEYHVIQQVVNNTVIILYDKPRANSTGSAQYRAAPVVFPANFVPSDPPMVTDNPINGLNSLVTSAPSYGNGVVASVAAIDSGHTYVEGEIVSMCPSDILTSPTIVAAGTGYTNGDLVYVIGGAPYKTATGSVTTNSSGSVTSITWTGGSGYQYVPRIYVKSSTGNGAVLTTNIQSLDTSTLVVGTVNKHGIGLQRGFWSTTRSFVSSDKYIQDSYYWQEFSYVLKAQKTLDKYRSILYETFHPAGSEMFGDYVAFEFVSSNTAVAFANATPTYS